jgi:hypothetical protein
MTIRDARFILVLIILPTVLPFAIPVRANSQSITLGPPQIAPVDVLTVNDIDFLNATTPKWLFTINMQSDAPVEAIMSISIDVVLTDASYPTAVVMTTESFLVDGVRNITNIDLVNGNPKVAENNIDQVAKSRLEETSLPGGKIPAGIYRFNVVVTPIGGTGSSASFEFAPTNPGSMQLLFPPDADQSVSELALFQWRYDGPRSRISIYERLPGQGSLEETISGVPHLTATVETNSFQYPSSGARLLEPGKSYAWVVEGLSGSAGGVESALKSEIRWFRISTQSAGMLAGILAELEAALGPSHKAVFDRMRAEGMTSEGTLFLNGTQIGQSDLIRLIELFRQDPDAVNLVELE